MRQGRGGETRGVLAFAGLMSAWLATLVPQVWALFVGKAERLTYRGSPSMDVFSLLSYATYLLQTPGHLVVSWICRRSTCAVGYPQDIALFSLQIITDAAAYFPMTLLVVGCIHLIVQSMGIQLSRGALKIAATTMLALSAICMVCFRKGAGSYADSALLVREWIGLSVLCLSIATFTALLVFRRSSANGHS